MTSSSPPLTIARRCLVHGRVQGVYYRASTRHKAMELGIAGSARNLPDGSVEVLALGPPDRVQALIDWLWIGSPASAVTRVDVLELEPASLTAMPVGFDTH